MSQKTLPASAIAAIVGAISPDATTAGVHTSDWVGLDNFQCLMAVIQTGSLGSGATVDAKIEQAKDAAGSDAKDLESAAITQLVKADHDDTQAIIEFWAEDLDLLSDYTHIRLSLTVGGATSDCGALIIGMNPRYGPASDYDATSVAEIVTV